MGAAAERPASSDAFSVAGVDEPGASAASTQAASGETYTKTTTTMPPSDAANRSRMLTVLFLYCASGTALTLANKLAVKRFPYPNLILIIQNSIAVATLALGSCTVPATIGQMPRLSFSLVRLWVPLTVTFSLMLASSLLALQEVSAVTLIVIRNLNSLSVAALEFACLGTVLPWQTVGSLLGILGGAVMYSLHDITFSFIGYSWLFLNLLSTSAYQVWVKRVVASDTGKKIGALGMSYVNNLLSLPVLFAVALANREVSGILGSGSGIWNESSAAGRQNIGSGGSVFTPPSVAAAASPAASGLISVGKAPMTTLNRGSVALLLVSGALGICLSVTAFMLNALISATSMMVANNVNKFFVILLSECFIQGTLDGFSSLGVVVVMLFGWLYGEASKRVPTAAKPAVAVLEVDISSRKKTKSTANKVIAVNVALEREILSNV